MSWFCPFPEETLTLWWLMKGKESVPRRHTTAFKNNPSLSHWGLGNESGQRTEGKKKRAKAGKRVRTRAGNRGKEGRKGSACSCLNKSNQNVCSHWGTRATSCGKTMKNVSMCTADIHRVGKGREKNNIRTKKKTYWQCKKTSKPSPFIRQRQSMWHQTHARTHSWGHSTLMREASSKQGHCGGGAAGNSFYTDAGWLRLSCIFYTHFINSNCCRILNSMTI